MGRREEFSNIHLAKFRFQNILMSYNTVRITLMSQFICLQFTNHEFIFIFESLLKCSLDAGPPTPTYTELSFFATSYTGLYLNCYIQKLYCARFGLFPVDRGRLQTGHCRPHPLPRIPPDGRSASLLLVGTRGVC